MLPKEPERPIATNVDPFVQEWVAGTNGRLYIPLIDNLPRYPIPDWPLPAANGCRLLDIGTGWGRWMISAGRKGYLPIGIDIKLDPLRAAKRVLTQHRTMGHVVAADLKHLPFKSGTFQTVFSYSVIQHVHKQWAHECVEEVHRILKNGGACFLQFPTKYGVGNLLKCIALRDEEEQDYDSWCVRYYSIAELKAFFSRLFGNFAYEPDCYFGIGVQKADIDMLPWKYKIVVALSEGSKFLSRFLPLLRIMADSVYVLSRKNSRSKTRSSPQNSVLPSPSPR